MCSCCGECMLFVPVVVSVCCVFLLWWVYVVCSCCGECMLCVLVVVVSVCSVFLLRCNFSSVLVVVREICVFLLW